MVSVSDILAILDKVPLWKSLKALPARMDALEKRLAALEGMGNAVPGRPCPDCGAKALRRTSSVPHPTFHMLGTQLETWTCQACGGTDKISSDDRR